MYANQDKGIAAGIFSGIFWGFPFVIPMILHDYTALEITFGRFLFFGIASLIYAKSAWRLFSSLTTAQKIRVFLLATTGFWLYALALSMGVQITNGVVAALIEGMLPVSVAIFSRPKVSKRFIVGLISIFIGLVFLVLPDVLKEANDTVSLAGVLVLLSALFMWTWFAIKNAKFLSQNPRVKGIEYASLLGIINAIMVLPIFFLSSGGITALVAHSNLVVFIICSLVLGLGSSWIANISWAYCSKNCPATIVGALIVSETVFGLLYSFIYQTRLPMWNECVAIAGLIIGVILVVFSQRKRYSH